MANEIAEAIRSASNLTAQLKQLDGMTNYGELLQAATALQEIAALLLVLAAAPAFAANFATCVLHKMPGTQNDVAAVAIYQVCRAKHGSSRPWRRARGAASSLPIRVPSAPPKRPETPAATGRRSLSGQLVGSCMTKAK